MLNIFGEKTGGLVCIYSGGLLTKQCVSKVSSVILGKEVMALVQNYMCRHCGRKISD
jgi:hypothetical protein